MRFNATRVNIDHREGIDAQDAPPGSLGLVATDVGQGRILPVEVADVVLPRVEEYESLGARPHQRHDAGAAGRSTPSDHESRRAQPGLHHVGNQAAVARGQLAVKGLVRRRDHREIPASAGAP